MWRNFVRYYMSDKYKLLTNTSLNWEPVVEEEKEEMDYHLMDFSVGQTLYICFHLILLPNFP